MKRLLSVLLTFIACLTVFVLPVYAEEPPNGISVSSDRLSQGDEFTVTLHIPPTENADTASIKFRFDGNAFEIEGWDVDLPGGYSNSGEDFAAFSAANLTRDIELSDGLDLNISMRAKDTAEDGLYRFELVDNSVCYVADNGIDFIELWFPDTLYADVQISAGETINDEEIAPEESEEAGDTANGESDEDEPPRKKASEKESEDNITKILIITGAAVLLAGLCFAAVRFGTGRK